MEQSYYNVRVALPKGGAILYNVRRETMLELNAADIARLEEVDARSTSPDDPLVTALSDAGMLVESAEEEAEEMLYQHTLYRYNKRTLDLTIMPTRACNCACDYCYVNKRNSHMSHETQALLLDFVERCYKDAPFTKLRVSWYGGEPLLALDVMEDLSAGFLKLCEERKVRYHGHVLTNGILADAATCKRLVENCGIVSIMPTISGNGRMHEWQRPARDGREYFDTFLVNIDCMLAAGMLVRSNYVVNHNNFRECNELSKRLCRKPDMSTRLTRTFAYGREGMVLKDGKDTPLELFERAEFSPYYAHFFREQNLGAAGYEELLRPQPLYCAAWVDRQYYIDEIGDAFACMIDMDYPEFALFNLHDRDHNKDLPRFNYTRKAAFMNMEPARDEMCRSCQVLPICQGGCAFWRILKDDVCHDLKDCIEEVVYDYYHALVAEGHIAPDQEGCQSAAKPYV